MLTDPMASTLLAPTALSPMLLDLKLLRRHSSPLHLSFLVSTTAFFPSCFFVAHASSPQASSSPPQSSLPQAFLSPQQPASLQASSSPQQSSYLSLLHRCSIFFSTGFFFDAAAFFVSGFCPAAAVFFTAFVLTWRAMRAALPVCTRQSMGILPLANRASDFTFLLSIARAPFLKFPCFVVLRLLAPPVAERLHWLASVPPASSDDFSLPGFPSGLGSYVSERLLFVSKFRPRQLTPANFKFDLESPPPP